METINTINDWIWTFIIIPLLGGCAVWFTFRTRGVQFRMLGHMIKLIMESPSSAGGSDGTAEKGQKHISSFHAFVISLASRIGTGNLAGVASAIFVGGPGAVFWMWVMALLGAATAFVESSLAQLYKRKVPGAFIGGPAYYMQYGLHCRWLGIVFSVLLMLSFGMANQMMQSNQICTSINDTFGFPIEWLTGVMAVFTGIIIFGGVHRIANFSSAVVPVMAIAYLLLAVVIIVMNITEVPHILKLIITNAFGLEQAAGGAIGTVISQGVKRGLFSNEAGEGSAPNAAATADTSHPIKQGLIQALGVFTDTIVICTCTAMTILIANVYTGNADDGIILTTRSLETEIGSMARYFVSAAIFFFAYSSIIGNYYYAETSVRFITSSPQLLFIFRIITMVMIVLGGYLTISEIWSLLDLCMAALVLANVTAILILSPKVIALLRDYTAQRREKKDPKFRAASIPEIAGDLDAWKQ